MKSLRNHLVASLLITFSFLYAADLFGQGTAFIYQGRLNDNGSLASGSYDFRFRLASDSLGTNFVGSPILSNALPVSSGLFNVTLNFGAGIFTGSNYWLQVDVKTNGGASYTTLTPLQALAPSPYAIFANTASNLSASGLSGTYPNAVTFNNAGNSFSGSGAGLTALNASQLTSGVVPAGVLSNAWKITGNSGTTAGTHFLGTTDNQPVEIKVNNLRALRFENNGDGADTGTNPDGAPNLIGGSPANFASAGTVGVTIAGGGSTNFNGFLVRNTVGSDYTTIGGGLGHSIASNAIAATIAGGYGNSIAANSTESAVGGGFSNDILGGANDSTIAGGFDNSIGTNSYYSAIGGGYSNGIGTNSDRSVIGGGATNSIDGDSFGSTIAGGAGNAIGAHSEYNSIGGGIGNTLSTYTEFGTIGGGQNNKIQDDSYQSTIGGGGSNTIQTNADHSTIAGGTNNRIQNNADHSTINGGHNHTIQTSAYDGTIGGGYYNTVETDAAHSTIGGGSYNTIQTEADHSVIAGGEHNTNSGSYATVPGGDMNVAGTNSFAAGHRAKATHTGTFIWADSTDADFSSTAANQFLIRASGGVGLGTTAPESPLHVFDGSAGSTTANASSIATFERSGNAYLSVLTPTNSASGIIFGSPYNDNDAGVYYNSVVSRGLALRTSGNITRMVIDSSGNVGIGTNAPANKLHVNGGITCTALTETSDRNAKENFKPVSPQDVLAKVAALPISKWNYKEMPGQPHIGPTAQDFYAAFGLGSSDKTITTVDPDGVALAAIQGLNQKFDERDAKIERLQKQNDSLQEQLRELKDMVARLAHGSGK